MSDFMGGMFDFNGDGHTDSGEEYMAYRICEDSTKGSPAPRRAHKTDWFDVVLIGLLIYAVLDGLCRMLY